MNERVVLAVVSSSVQPYLRLPAGPPPRPPRALLPTPTAAMSLPNAEQYDQWWSQGKDQPNAISGGRARPRTGGA